MTRTVSILLLIILSFAVQAQEPEYLGLVKAETALQDLFNQLYSDTLSESGPVLNRIREIMNVALVADGAMQYPWSRLNRIGVIPSDDGNVRIFTWHVMDDVDNYRYFGYVQVAMKRGKIRLYELMDNQKEQRDVRMLQQSAEAWYGKLYYKIVSRNYKRKTYYTLLGMDFNNGRSIIKTVEAMTIQRNKPQFIRGFFLVGSDYVDRIVLEYSTQVASSVRYDPGLKMITFDHLVPFHPIYNGNYEFYGPDGSFDGLEFKAGTWIFREDIDVRNLD
ncbi:MAG: hypothetical protein ABFS38_08965 [Bacteroidota bacterium]